MFAGPPKNFVMPNIQITNDDSVDQLIKFFNLYRNILPFDICTLYLKTVWNTTYTINIAPIEIIS